MAVCSKSTRTQAKLLPIIDCDDSLTAAFTSPRHACLFEPSIPPFDKRANDGLHGAAVFGRRVAHAAARIVANRARDQAVAFEFTQLCGKRLVRHAIKRAGKLAETARRESRFRFKRGAWKTRDSPTFGNERATGRS